MEKLRDTFFRKNDKLFLSVTMTRTFFNKTTLCQHDERLSACKYSGSRDFTFEGAVEISSLRLRLGLRLGPSNIIVAAGHLASGAQQMIEYILVIRNSYLI